MKRALKYYFAFTNKIYRFVALILLPLIAVVAVMIAGFIDVELMSLAIVGYYALFMLAEPLTDHWFLGGFYGKKKGALRFMQSSNHFSTVMRDVVVVDIIRRVLVNAVLFLLMIVSGILGDINPRGYVLYVFMALLEILFGEIVVFIGRHFDLWNHYYAVIVLGYMVAIIVMLNSVILFEKYLGIICVVMALLAIGMAVVTVMYTNKKVRDSYYDK